MQEAQKTSIVDQGMYRIDTQLYITAAQELLQSARSSAAGTLRTWDLHKAPVPAALHSRTQVAARTREQLDTTYKSEFGAPSDKLTVR